MLCCCFSSYFSCLQYWPSNFSAQLQLEMSSRITRTSETSIVRWFFCWDWWQARTGIVSCLTARVLRRKDALWAKTVAAGSRSFTLMGWLLCARMLWLACSPSSWRRSSFFTYHSRQASTRRSSIGRSDREVICSKNVVRTISDALRTFKLSMAKTFWSGCYQASVTLKARACTSKCVPIFLQQLNKHNQARKNEIKERWLNFC